MTNATSFARTPSAIETQPRAEAITHPLHGGLGATATPADRGEPARHGRRLLVCLDRSTPSEVCVAHAISLARTFGSAVTLVHVMQPSHEHAGPQSNDALGWEISRQESQGYLERVQTEVSQALGRAVEIRLEQGRPAERIVDLAREVSADLIIIGSRGDGGTGASSLGSTASQVLAAAHGSVFVAHPGAGARIEASPKRILVPLDGSLRGESVLPAAARIARAFGAELLLVHVVQEPLATALLPAAEDMALARTLAGRLESGAARYLARLRQQLAHDRTSVRTLVLRHASEPQCLLEMCEREQVDLVVLSAHGSTCASARTFGSVTASLLTRTSLPLLILQDLPDSDVLGLENQSATVAPPSPRATYSADVA